MPPDLQIVHDAATTVVAAGDADLPSAVSLSLVWRSRDGSPRVVNWAAFTGNGDDSLRRLGSERSIGGRSVRFKEGENGAASVAFSEKGFAYVLMGSRLSLHELEAIIEGLDRETAW